jgi:hypothetical protein
MSILSKQELCVKNIKNKNSGNRSTSPPYEASTLGVYNLGKNEKPNGFPFFSYFLSR